MTPGVPALAIVRSDEIIRVRRRLLGSEYAGAYTGHSCLFVSAFRISLRTRVLLLLLFWRFPVVLMNYNCRSGVVSTRHKQRVRKIAVLGGPLFRHGPRVIYARHLLPRRRESIGHGILPAPTARGNICNLFRKFVLRAVPFGLPFAAS